MRLWAIIWLVLVLSCAAYLGVRAYEGIRFETDLMALLPQEERDPVKKQEQDAVTKSLSQQIVILISGANGTDVLPAARVMKDSMRNTQLIQFNDVDTGKAAQKQIWGFYFPYRSGLLSAHDRTLLLNAQGKQVAERAVAQTYSFTGISDPSLLRKDPFLLMPSFFIGLSAPDTKFSFSNGFLTLKENGKTWVMLTGKLNGEPYSVDSQEIVVSAYTKTKSQLSSQYPDVDIIHTGAVFFADAGSKQAMGETSTIGVVSTIGVLLVLIFVFRAVSPIILSFMTLGVGMLCALSFSLMIFDNLHVGALLFGVSLIGIAVDYSLEYCSEIFYPASNTPMQRLKKSVMGISLGTATTAIGYLTFFFAPFPGLKQVAIFSTVGLLASWVTVVLWLPLLDNMKEPKHRVQMMDFFAKMLRFWLLPKYLLMRRIVFAFLLVAMTMGLFLLKIDDDVRHLQTLSAGLKAEQIQIQNITKHSQGTAFFIVKGSDLEQTLQREEKLNDALFVLVNDGDLGSYNGITNFFPSIARQKENRILGRTQLYAPLLKDHLEKIQLDGHVELSKWNDKYLTESDLPTIKNIFPFLSYFILEKTGGETAHIVMLNNLKNIKAIEQATKDMDGISLINPVQNVSDLLEKYRVRAIYLLIISTVLMMPLLFWRYGIKHAMKMIVPPLLTVIFTPGLCALFGLSFTFFNAMALVLVLSFAIDYVIFCSESHGGHRPVTLLAITMTGTTTALSFGLLALSSVSVVQSFGATMLAGMILSYLFSPMAFKKEEN